MMYDRQLTISAASSRWAETWPAQALYWSEMLQRLAVPARGQETLATYLRMPKKDQDQLKDVGGYVGGELIGGRRKNHAVKGRDIITLDMDAIPAGGTDDVLRRVASLGCAWAVYSTRKHEPSRPRLRVLMPLLRTVTADEYEPIARKMADLINIGWCDPTTFQAVRLMYWPSCSADGQFVYMYEDKPFVDPDGVLSLYANWHDVASWPTVPGQKIQQALAEKQEDPTTKPGVVGAFCRQYNVYQAMDTFLQGVYEPVENGEGRYTFTGGSTTGGAVIYEDGKFLYSHHATDPAGGKLVNSFDLVRLHLFSKLDDEAKEGTPVIKMPSYERMKQFAVSDPQVALAINQASYDQAVADFGQLKIGGADANWMLKLRVSPNSGKPDKCAANVMLLLENDPLLAGRFNKDTFSDRVFGTAPLPWGRRENEAGPFSWEESDDAGLRIHVERVLGFRSRDIIEDAFRDHVTRHSFNPVQEYLRGLTWDGVPRLDTLFIDFLGAADSEYTRAVTRKAFTAAVARAMDPGVKFDFMTILTGSQGIGKSTLLRKMGKSWFSDSIKSFEGKEASELVQGVWLVEIGELEAFNKSDISRIKQFLSQGEDIYRAAYGRVVEWHPRRCVFFGTSNNREYLRDRTGNRRFWPVDVNAQAPTKSVFRDLDEIIDQLWAEAVARWSVGELLYLTGNAARDAEEAQEAHRERSSREGLILEYLERKVPTDWHGWDLARRQGWLYGCVGDTVELVERGRICALEVWCECLKGDLKSMRYQDAAEINSIISVAPGWFPINGRFGYAGRQRGFCKVP